MSAKQAFLQINNLYKSFKGVKALDNVSFSLQHGEIHALLGENGAGKSTLIKVLTGIYRKDQGEIFLEGRPFIAETPGKAVKSGISTVYQEVGLIPNLSVAENIYLGRQPTRFGHINWRKINHGAKEALKLFNLDIDVTQPVGDYSLAIQQLVAITRALQFSVKILILDEPTSSLDEAEVKMLFQSMLTLKRQGIAIVFVTHFLDQIFAISDRMTILRNGQLVGSYQTSGMSRLELVSKMLGKPPVAQEAIAITQTSEDSQEDVYLSARGIERSGSVKALDIDIKEGEILGLAGLLGSGRTELLRLIFGIDRISQGRIKVKGKETNINSPRKAIEKSMAFCPEDRKEEGILPDLSVRENIILALQARKGIFRKLKQATQDEIVHKLMVALQIKAASPEQALKYLSGGNQQKVIIARWLAANPKLLILDEPTRGIDIGAKAEIQNILKKLSSEGMAILFVSSELDEVIHTCDRVAVMRDRSKVKELLGEEITEPAILNAIAGKPLAKQENTWTANA